MNVDSSPSRVQEIAALVRDHEYRVDPAAVAEAMMRRMTWDDVPQLVPAATQPLQPAKPSRLRMLIPVGHLVSAPMPPRAPLSV